ncbi:MAG: response regulator [Spirochaetales bacterium]|nr:response regulator [Spirochaetales bacterium]
MIIVFFPGNPAYAEEAHPQILILNSYHQGEDWSDNEIAGILPALKKVYPFLVPSIENLDSKRFPGTTHLLFLKKYLIEKYQGTHFDLIMVLDDSALNLMLQYKKELFPGVPVVFAGVNGYKPEILAEREMTGVVEFQDIKGTLDLALQIHPETKTVMAVHDYTSSGLALRDEMETEEASFPENLSIKYSGDGTIEELAAQLRELPKNSIVLLLTYVTDKSVRTFTREESTRIISSASPVPVYAMHETRLGYGIVGGLLLEGREHGRQAAALALRILDGEKVSSIPVERSLSRTVFDYTVLSRFGIKLNSLPADSVIMNHPETVWDRNKAILIPGFFIFGLLMVFLGFLIALVLRMRRSEEALYKSERQLYTLVDSLGEGVILQDASEEILLWNSTAAEIFNLETEEIVGRKATNREWNSIHEDGTPFPVQDHPSLHTLRTGEPCSGVIMGVWRNEDDRKWIKINTRPLFLKGEDKPYAALISFSDITENRLADEKLRQSHEKFLTILESIDATIYVADMDTYEILFMNKNMTETFGRDMTGEICYKVFRGEKEPCACCTNSQLLDKQGNPAGVIVWQDKNPITGKFFTNHDRAIEWIDGRIVRLQIATELTEYRKMEEQLRQAQKMESVGRLAGGVAHDFNNMLSVILGYTEYAMEQIDPESQIFNPLQEIHKAARHSAHLTRQLLGFARKQAIIPRVLDLNDTVEGMINMLRRLIGEDINLTWLPGKDLWPVKMDPSQIDQMLANLCVNARDAISGVGKLCIETSTVSLSKVFCDENSGCIPGDYVLITVRDDGCGMDQQTLDNLFEPFFTTKNIGKGTGLGLATVYGIVKQNEGFINVVSEPDKGTTFSIFIPRYQSLIPISQNNSSAISSSQGEETILLVEDEPAILEMTSVMLELSGYTILPASTPLQALQKAREYSGEIHLLITDVVMPEMNGKELAGKLFTQYPGLKTLYMSGYTADIIAHHGIMDEDLHFVQKPFTREILTSKVREVLDK